MRESPEAPLMLSVSGARGIVGASMTAEVASRFALAFGTVIREMRREGVPEVALGRDSRPSGAMMAEAAARGLQSAGCAVIDLGIVMTPTVGLTVAERRAAGGMVITASHNPSQWNGLKCLTSAGAAPAEPMAAEIVRRFRAIAEVEPSSASAMDDRGEAVNHDPSANQRHVRAVLRALGPDSINRIRQTHCRVVLDSVNGAGGPAGRALLDALGCDVIHLNAEPTGAFAHPPEPIEENLRDVCHAVAGAEVMCGFAQDPDGDRLAVVNETGRYIGEEYTFALCALRALARIAAERNHPSSVNESAMQTSGLRIRSLPGATLATNLSTSRMIDDVAAQYDHLQPRVMRAAVGEANVVEALMGAGDSALLGGEGNGGVIWPEVCWVRDSLGAMALILDLLASRQGALSSIIDSLPRYVMIKRKIDLAHVGGRDAVPSMIERVTRNYAGDPSVRINDSDGVRVDLSDAWVHLRPSNTEPIVRLIAEAPARERCENLLNDVAALAGLGARGEH